MHIAKTIMLIAFAMFTFMTQANNWTLNKIDHPVLNELMVRNIYVAPDKRIYLSTDSGVYRYSNKRLTKLDDKFNGTGKAYNGPINRIRPFDERHLIIAAFPYQFLLFDTVADEYVEHPFLELLQDDIYKTLYYSTDRKKTVMLLMKSEGLYEIDNAYRSTSLVYSFSNDFEAQVYKRSEESPLYILDISAGNTDISAKPNKEIKMYTKTSEGLNLITNFNSSSPYHNGYYVGTNLVLLSGKTLRIFDGGILSKTTVLPDLCDVNHSSLNRTDKEKFYGRAMPNGDSNIILFSACGLHRYNIFTDELQFLHKADDKEIGNWHVINSSSIDNIHLIITTTDIYILDEDRFEKISAPSLSAERGTVASLAKIDDNQYLIADGTPGLKIATNTISKFQSLKQSDLMRLTGGLSLRHVIKDNEDNLWLSSQTNGLILAAFKDGEWFKKAHFLEKVHVRSLFEYEQEIWVATEGEGLWVIDSTTMEIELLDTLQKYYGALKFLRLKTNGQYTNQILISTTDGVLIYDLSAKQFVKKIDGLSGAIWAMAQDDNGHLWFGSHDTGLHRLNNDFKIVENHSIEELFDSVLLDITIDDNNQPVLATWGAGVLYRKQGDTTFTQLSAQNGLPNDTVQSILRDDNGYYWISTDLGLARFSLCHTEDCKQNLINFTRADGLPTNLYDLNSAHKHLDGSLIYGGFFGLVWFHPIIDIRQNEHLPTNHNIDSLYVNRVNITNQINTKDDSQYVELPYGVDDVRLRYGSDDYILEDKKRYRYKINKSDWIQTDTPEIVMPAPRYGSYFVEASSSNSNGMWSSNSLTVEIKIAPPIWASAYAFVFYGLLLIALIFSFYRIKSLRLVRLNETLQQAVVSKTKALAEKNTELEQSIKQQEQMFENASHDLKTPISIIASCHELITNKTVPEHVEYHIRLAMKHSERLKEIVNRILVREKNKLFGVSTDTDIIQIIRNEINDRENLVQAKALSISHNIIEDQICYVAASESALVTMVGNLLDNAIKYSPSHGAIVRVDISQYENNVSLRIIDQGKGIEDISLFGQRYYRESDNYEGSGIGVASALELANNYKGEISAKNLSEGGFEVTLTLPQIKQTTESSDNEQAFDAKTADAKQIEQIGQDFTVLNVKPTVLYVEDEQDVIETFKKHCTDKINIVHASDGKQAISVLKSAPITKLPDLILSDVMMPNMDGYTLCSWLKNSEDFQHIPTILLTAKSDLPSTSKGLELGADDYIDKFVSPTQIIQKILNIVSTVKAKERRLRKFVTSANEDAQAAVGHPLAKLIQNELNANFSDSKYTLGDLCAALHKSESTVTRRLQQHLGRGFSDLLFEKRMSHAEKLLAGSLQIGEVAARCGFENSAYFSKRFKERYKITPSAFRRSKRTSSN